MSDFCGIYNVRDVSHYIIERSLNINSEITNLRLQKLLYFVQGFKLLATDGENSMFKESLLAWSRGPVVREAYDEYSIWGISPITDFSNMFTLKFDGKRFLVEDDVWICPLSQEDKTLINSVVDNLRKFSNIELIDLATKEGGPWSRCYDKDESNVISRSEIYEYFRNMFIEFNTFKNKK